MKRRSGFTLIELVVVVLILGILAGVAAPKLFDTSAEANETVLKQTLKIVRDAITLYSANNAGNVPGADNSEATFKSDLARYLRKFPANPMGVNPARSDSVLMISIVGPLELQINNNEGWIYNSKTGEFMANDNSTPLDGIGNIFDF